MLFFNVINIKYSVFFFFLFFYFFIIILLISYLFFFSLLQIKYVSELKCSNILIYEYIIISIILSFSGLPPFFFFFVKYCLISNILINGFFINSFFCVFLIFLSWFIYFTAVRYIVLTKNNKFIMGYKHSSNYSSFLGLFLFFGFFFLFTGFFFIYDFLLYFYYIFMN